ncbi:hypothetical protein [Mucilaginibacter sp.]
MNINEKINQQNLSSRRKFVWGASILSAFVATAATIGGSFWNKKKNATSIGKGTAAKTIKMLTEDGKLVEIDASLITTNAKKVTDAELKNWIKK